MRPLSPEESALWARVTATITPLSRDKATEPKLWQEALASGAAPQPSKSPAGRIPAPAPAPPPRPRRVTIHGNLDGHWERRLKNGSIAVDRVLDLHGLSLDAAWDAIDLALERAVAGGDRVLLLITGHHRPGEPPVQRGRIRAAVHDWLAVSRHADRIAAVRSAHRRHGGGGSLYLILRR